MLWSSFAAIVAGFALLVWGADRFVLGASATARNLGVSPLVIGLTIVGFGTSAPEMLVSGVAAWNGTPGIGVGNAIGSNITNIGLVLGVTALLVPLGVHSETLRREFPVTFAVMLTGLALLMDGRFDRVDGVVLVAGMGLMIYWMAAIGLRERRDSDPLESEYEEEIPRDMPTWRALAWLLAGLLVLLGSSRLLVWGAVNVAEWFGVSELVIGLTVVAIGTSLPELAATLVSAYKGEHDIAVGNVLGSNMFNLLGVLGLPGLIAPHAVDPAALTRDYPFMIGLSVTLFAMAYGFRNPGRITRLKGFFLLCGYCGYLLLLYFTLSTR